MRDETLDQEWELRILANKYLREFSLILSIQRKDDRLRWIHKSCIRSLVLFRRLLQNPIFDSNSTEISERHIELWDRVRKRRSASLITIVDCTAKRITSTLNHAAIVVNSIVKPNRHHWIEQICIHAAIETVRPER